jgi:hypothetical protein
MTQLVDIYRISFDQSDLKIDLRNSGMIGEVETVGEGQR